MSEHHSDDTHHPTPLITPCTLEVLLFDFGGVLAEEGFRNGLIAIACRNGLDSEQFVATASEVMFGDGFVTGHSDEKTFWQTLREKTGIQGTDETLRNEILSCFEIRSWMLEHIKRLKAASLRVAILSDQTNWLDELNERHHFFKWFDHVFNSYHLGKSKKDPRIFDEALSEMHTTPDRSLFIDDNGENIERAKKQGLYTIHYRTRETFEQELSSFCPSLKCN
jgi:putative hydrolase of the HAD superfamily